VRLARQPVTGADGADHADHADDEARFITDDLATIARSDHEIEEPPDSGALVLLQLPFLVAWVAFAMTRLLLGTLVVNPPLALLWRRRRLLADATAVELTRNPDALAEALEHLQRQRPAAPPGPFAHLFVVGDSPHDPQAQPEAATMPSPAPHTADIGSLELVSLLPPLQHRLARLYAMGARAGHPSATPTVPAQRRSPWRLVASILSLAVGGPLVACLVALLLAINGGLISLSLTFQLALFALPVTALHTLLR